MDEQHQGEQHHTDVPVDGIAVTAIGVAVIRARETERADSLYEDPLAQNFVDAAREGFSPDRWERLSALADQFYEGRTVGVRLVDDGVRAASDAGVRQYVLIGAGLDTRAFRMGLPPGTVVFEIDLPETFAFKEPVLRGAQAEPTCRRHVVVADLQGDWQTALLDAGFQPDRPTQWVDEGTLGHLTQEWTRRVVQTLTGMSAPGSRFGAGRYTTEHDSDRYRKYRQVVAGDDAPSTEPATSRLDGPDFDVEHWLGELGWATEFHSWNEMVAPLDRNASVDDPRVGTISAIRR
ncbi:MAG: SAM-dependent methyltransferase [Tomitella sp.]|nr:SAM-dependent methyltransferase [Tomitella sp.]